MRLLVDVSSVLWQSLLAGRSVEFGKEVEFEGKKVWVNGSEHGIECAVAHITHVLDELSIHPSNMILVVEGMYSKSRRKAVYPAYKEGRGSRPPESYDAFETCKTELASMFRYVGAQTVSQIGVESDDVISYLCKKLTGKKVILSQDGDLAAEINDDVSMWRNGALLTSNPFGPFPCNKIVVYKSLVGDSSDNIKGCPKFGEKAFLDFLVWGGDAGLAALQGMIERQTLHELEDDVAEFKPMRKIIDGADSIYTSYEVATLHSEWVDVGRTPLVMESGPVAGSNAPTDSRVSKFLNGPIKQEAGWWDELHPVLPKIAKNHAVFDCELIGTENPVFLVCVRVIETGEKASFWWHVEGDMDKLHTMLQRNDLTWISFNGIHFDAPLISAAICGKTPKTLKEMAKTLIDDSGKSWEMSSLFNYDTVKFDHIDLIEVSPGVRISLKAYAGRMAYPTMVDLPFHHDLDLNQDQCVVLERYCQNDLGVTEALFNRLRSEIDLRTEMSEEHGIDLRSKSDAQVAEAILKKAAKMQNKSGNAPSYVTYKTPSFIETDSDVINDLIAQMESTQFKINPANGQVVSPDFLNEPYALCSGTYQVGVGGLHSTHDKKLYAEATEEMLLSDFDVASYYPNIMLKAGLTPRVDGGARFIEEYRKIYERRLEAKRSGNKKVADALKISLNGTFGKLGSPYSAFYSPDLMLAVTLTGQLNLMCLIYDLEFNPSVKVMSANTDGILVSYPVRYREKVLRIIASNAERTGFEYEETRYRAIAMKDVNNYLAVTTDDKVKRKGLYASTGLMKNPTNQVCSDMAVDYLKSGIHPSESIKGYTDIKDFVAIRTVKGGGIQHDSFVEVDDWICVKDLDSKDSEWVRQAWIDDGTYNPDLQGGGRSAVKRKSRPKPIEVGVGGEFFGRIARWYIQKDGKMPINYAGSGNKVPKTDGAKLCMTLPDGLPDDLDRDWYVNEALAMLGDMGVQVINVPELMQSIVNSEVCVHV